MDDNINECCLLDVTGCTYILVGPAACHHISQDGTLFHCQCPQNPQISANAYDCIMYVPSIISHGYL
jgi:hypothetical protein